MSALTMPSSVFPQTEFPRVVILIDKGAMPAEQMMASVTRPVEEAMKDIPGRRQRAQHYRPRRRGSEAFSSTGKWICGNRNCWSIAGCRGYYLPPDGVADFNGLRSPPSR